MINEGEDCPQVYESREVRNMLEEDADIKKLFIRKTGAGPQVEIAGVGKVSLEEAEKLLGKDVRWSRGESGSTTTYKILNTSSAEDVNKIFKDTMGYEPPYKPGTRLRTGEVNPLFGFDGGGQQYDLIINRKNVGTFTNERTIGQ